MVLIPPLKPGHPGRSSNPNIELATMTTVTPGSTITEPTTPDTGTPPGPGPLEPLTPEPKPSEPGATPPEPPPAPPAPPGPEPTGPPKEPTAPLVPEPPPAGEPVKTVPVPETAIPEPGAVTPPGPETGAGGAPTGPTEAFQPQMIAQPAEVSATLHQGEPGQLPGYDELVRRANEGDARAQRDREAATRGALEHLSRTVPSVEVLTTQGDSHPARDGQMLPGTNTQMRFEPEDRGPAMDAIARAAGALGFEGVQVRQHSPDGQLGQINADGTHNTLTITAKLRPGSEARAAALAANAGRGFSVHGNTLEAYYAGDPRDDAAFQLFGDTVLRTLTALGPDATQATQAIERLGNYGRGGNPLPSHDGQLPAGRAPAEAASGRVAEVLNGVNGVTPAARTARRQQRQIAQAQTDAKALDQAQKALEEQARQQPPSPPDQWHPQEQAVYAMQPVALDLGWDDRPPDNATAQENDAYSEAKREQVLERAANLPPLPPIPSLGDGLPVIVGSRGVGRFSKKLIDPAKMAIIDNLPAVLEQAKPVPTDPTRRGGNHPDWEFSYVAARVTVDGVPVIARISTYVDTRPNQWDAVGKRFIYSLSVWHPAGEPGGMQREVALAGQTRPRAQPPQRSGAATRADTFIREYDKPVNATAAPPALPTDISLIEATDRAPAWWASAVARAVSGIAGKAAKGKPFSEVKNQPMGWFAAIKSSPGIRAEELAYLKLEDWLKQQAAAGVKNVTAQDLLDYIRANALQLTETVGHPNRQNDYEAARARQRRQEAEQRGFIEDQETQWSNATPVMPSRYQIEDEAEAYIDEHPELIQASIDAVIEQRFLGDYRGPSPGHERPVLFGTRMFEADKRREMSNEVWDLYNAQQPDTAEPMLPGIVEPQTLEEIAKQVYLREFRKDQYAMNDVRYDARYDARKKQQAIITERMRTEGNLPQRYDVRVGQFHYTVTDFPKTDRTEITDYNHDLVYEGERLDATQVNELIRGELVDRELYLSRPEEERRIAEEQARLAAAGPTPAPTADELELRGQTREPQYTREDWQPLKGGTDYREIMITLPHLGGTYQAPHYHGVKDIVLHVRLVRTKNAQGEDVLMILEIQSDLHQKARDFGYRGQMPVIKQDGSIGFVDDPQNRDEYQLEDHARQLLQEAKQRYTDAINQATERLGLPLDPEARRRVLNEMAKQAMIQRGEDPNNLSDYAVESEAQQIGQNIKIRAAHDAEVEKARRLRDDLEELAYMWSYRPPKAPFGQTWNELAFARMIQYAAVRGIKWVAWTPGEFQTDPWATPTRQNITAFSWKRETDPYVGLETIVLKPEGGKSDSPVSFSMNGVLRPGQAHMGQGTNRNATLEEVLGPQLAARVRAEPTGRVEAEPGKGDLSFSGKGMEVAYNIMYRKAVENVLKKLDKSVKVEMQHMPQMQLQPRAHSRRVRRNRTEEITNGPLVFAFQITPQIEEAAKHGIEVAMMAQRRAEEQRALYPLELGRDPQGVPDRPGARVVAAQHVVKKFVRAMDFVLRKGVAGQRRTVRGFYRWSTGVGRVRDMQDITDVTHEGGHKFDHKYRPLLQPLITAYEPELVDIARNFYPGVVPKDRDAAIAEGFATFFHLYLNNPLGIEAEQPQFYHAFDEWLKRTLPSTHRDLMEIRRDIADYRNTPSRALGEAQIVSGRRETSWQAVKRMAGDGTATETAATLFNQVYTKTFDNLHPVTVAIRQIKQIVEHNMRIALKAGTMTMADVKRITAQLDVKGRLNPIAMLQLARNGYHAGQDWLMQGATDFFTGNRVAKGLAEIVANGVHRGRNKIISSTRSERTNRDWDLYLVARQDLEEIGFWEQTILWVQGGKQGPKPDVLRYQSPTGVTRGDREQTIQSLEQQYPHFKAAALDYYKFMNALLKFKHDAGIMTDEEYQQALKIKNYAPRRRKIEKESTGSLVGKVRGTGRDRLMRGRQGGTSDIISPMESSAQIAYETAGLVQQNLIKQSLVNLVEMSNAVGPGAGAILEQIPETEVTALVTQLQQLVKAAQSQLTVPQELNDMFDANQTNLGMLIEQLIPKATEVTVWGRTLISAEGRPIMFVLNKGKFSAYYVSDEGALQGLHDALTAGPFNYPPDFLTTILTTSTAVFRLGVTTHPPYALANFIRDTIQYTVFYPGFIPGWSSLKGIYHVVRNDKIAQAFAQANGMVGGMANAQLDSLRIDREVNVLRKRGFLIQHFTSWRGITRLLELTETGSRVGVFGIAYRRGLKDGLSHNDAAVEAAFTAQDVMNFGRYGSNMLFAKRFVAFLNTNLQGLDKQARLTLGGEGALAVWRKQVAPLFASDPIERQRLPLSASEKQALNKALYAWTAMSMLGIVSAMLKLAYWDDDEYDAFSPYIKATRWMVKMNDTWYAIPKPYSLAIVANSVEAAMDYWGKQDPTAFQQMREQFLFTTAPPFENPLVKTLYEEATNTDLFTGKPIVTDQARPAFMQYDAYTSELSKWMAKLTADATHGEGISPQRLDHIITSMGASWGRALLRGSDMLRENAPERTWQDNPFTSYFIKDWKRGSTMATSFYQQVSKTNGKWVGAYNAYHSLVEAGALQQASQLLDMYDDNTKAYAILNQYGDDREKRLHPIRRAETVVSVTNEMVKEMLMGDLHTNDGKGPDVVMSPSVRRIAMETLGTLRLREMRNALVVLGVEGWAQKKVLNTEEVVKQLHEIDPHLVTELTARIGNKAYPFDVLRELWPSVKQEVLDKGEKEQLRSEVGRALAAGRRDYWTEGDGP